MINEPPEFTETEFRKSSFSEPDKECVQVARRGGWVAIRDTKTTFGASDDHHLLLTANQFDSFLMHFG
ncbi:DUF397 domain-containing protein [Kibdelosporangium aridum]|uniref:DUF397 domain-containing protein n=1 Tax=Kibdelosporangium aridum TaxID=2030 RepID=UPI0035EF16B6